MSTSEIRPAAPSQDPSPGDARKRSSPATKSTAHAAPIVMPPVSHPNDNSRGRAAARCRSRLLHGRRSMDHTMMAEAASAAMSSGKTSSRSGCPEVMITHRTNGARNAYAAALQAISSATKARTRPTVGSISALSGTPASRQGRRSQRLHAIRRDERRDTAEHATGKTSRENRELCQTTDVEDENPRPGRQCPRRETLLSRAELAGDSRRHRIREQIAARGAEEPHQPWRSDRRPYGKSDGSKHEIGNHRHRGVAWSKQ